MSQIVEINIDNETANFVLTGNIEEILSNLNLEVVPFSQEQALRAGILRPSTKSLGLSLGDRACLALGLYLKLPILTADKLWSNLNLAVEIRLIR